MKFSLTCQTQVLLTGCCTGVSCTGSGEGHGQCAKHCMLCVQACWSALSTARQRIEQPQLAVHCGQSPGRCINCSLLLRRHVWQRKQPLERAATQSAKHLLRTESLADSAERSCVALPAPQLAPALCMGPPVVGPENSGAGFQVELLTVLAALGWSGRLACRKLGICFELTPAVRAPEPKVCVMPPHHSFQARESSSGQTVPRFLVCLRLD